MRRGAGDVLAAVPLCHVWLGAVDMLRLTCDLSRVHACKGLSSDPTVEECIPVTASDLTPVRLAEGVQLMPL